MADECCTQSRLCTQEGKKWYTHQSSLFWDVKMILCLELNLAVSHRHSSSWPWNMWQVGYCMSGFHRSHRVNTCSFAAMPLLVIFCKVFCELACWFSSKCAGMALYRQHRTFQFIKSYVLKNQKIYFLSPQKSKEGIVCGFFTLECWWQILYS